MSLYQCGREFWNIFRKYHYLNHDINKNAKCFILTYNNRPIAFRAVISMPTSNGTAHLRGHRLVVLPDFQGLGIGTKFTEIVARIVTEKYNKKFFICTSNPAFIHSLKKNLKFKLISFGHKSLKGVSLKSKNNKYKGSSSRVTASFQYIRK